MSRQMSIWDISPPGYFIKVTKWSINLVGNENPDGAAQENGQKKTTDDFQKVCGLFTPYSLVPL